MGKLDAATRPMATSQDDYLRFGLIGYGYWGPLLLRSLERIEHAEVALVADLSTQRLAEAKRNHPRIEVTNRVEDVIEGQLDAVLIATPLSSHFALARSALLHKKHVFVEKPLTTTSVEARELIEIAQIQQRTLMVGHTFEYSPEVVELRKMVSDGDLGKIFYIDSNRLNLGIFRKDADVLWDLAPHDLSIINFVLGMRPSAISARGSAHLHDDILDVAYMDLVYGEGITAHVHVSWLNPNKDRRFTIVGDRRMVLYDDTAGNEKSKIYDRGVDRPTYATSYGEFQLSYRYGEIVIPYVQGAEPLAVECQHFADSIRQHSLPRSNGEVGRTIVRILEAAHESIIEGSKYIPLSWD